MARPLSVIDSVFYCFRPPAETILRARTRKRNFSGNNSFLGSFESSGNNSFLAETIKDFIDSVNRFRSAKPFTRAYTRMRARLIFPG